MIKLENLALERGGRTLLEGVDATFADGSLTALIGRNGAGKTTLMRTIAGLDVNYSGRVTFEPEGENRAQTVAVVTTERIRISNMTVREVVALGRAPYSDWLGRLTAGDREAVERALETVGIAGMAGRQIDTLSDGERQRVMIARALAQSTPAILLDEPTSFLDLPGRYHLCRLLAEIAHGEGKCIVMSTHELDIAIEMADAVGLIDGRQLRILPTDDDRTRVTIAEAFGLPTERLSRGGRRD